MPLPPTKFHQPASWALLVLAGLFVGQPGEGWAQEVTTTSAAASDDEVELRFRDYEAKIQALLKTRLNEEKAFVSLVMEKVRAGEIPEKMVETSYKWVLNKHPDTNYPFVYFERVLRIQGDKAGIEIPPFDYEVYRQRLGRRSSKSNS
jgi:hypothetical protein